MLDHVFVACGFHTGAKNVEIIISLDYWSKKIRIADNTRILESWECEGILIV